MSRTAMQTVNHFYDRVKVGDLAGASEVFVDELVWVEPPFPGHPGGTFHGKANILQNVVGPFVSTWTDFKATPDRIIDGGNEIVVLGRYSGKHHRTGKPFEARFAHTWTLADGMATRFEMLADTIQFFRTVE